MTHEVPREVTLHNTPSRERVRRVLQRKRVHRVRAERGIALVLAMTSVAILFMLAAQIRENAITYTTAANASRDELLAYYEAKSIINLSRLVVFSEPTIRKAMVPVLAPLFMMMGRGMTLPQVPIWEKIDVLVGPFRKGNDGTFEKDLGVSFSGAKGMGGLRGASVPVVVDEDSKININGFDRGPHIARRVAQKLLALTGNPSFEPFFSQKDSDGQHTDRISLVSAMIDWADSDTDMYDVQSLVGTTVSGGGASGAEDTIYQNFHPPYQRKNAPYDSLNELRLVRGLGDDDLWQSMVDPESTDPHARTLTVWGSGLTNVNTANAQTQLALACAYAPPTTPVCIDPLIAAQFLSGISLLQMFTVSMGVPMYNDAKGFAATIRGQPPMGAMMLALGVPTIPVVGPQLEEAVTTESNVFSLYGESTIGLAHVRIHAVVDMRGQPAVPSMYLKGGQNTAPPASQDRAQGVGLNGNLLTATAGGTVVYWRED